MAPLDKARQVPIVPHAYRDRGLPGLIATAELVLETISEAIALVLEMMPDKRASSEGVRKLSSFLFKRLDVQRLRSTGLNEHLARGLFAYGQKNVAMRLSQRPADYPRPRLTDLVFLHCREAADQTEDGKVGEFVLIPSPVHVAIEALTVPEDIHTRAYALLACRMILSRRFNVWPEISFSAELPEKCVLLSESRIVEEIRSIRTFLEHRDNRSAKSSNVKQFVSHFIAGKGVFYLRLSRNDVSPFLRKGIFSASGAKKDTHKTVPEFRLSSRYRELPQAASFVNELLGVPLALRGADTIFFNGLKPSADHSLVMEVSGGPGTGKTSFALALAAAFAPLDTHTFYLSFEEHENDLQIKLAAQSQPRLRRLGFNYRDDFSWFTPLLVPDLELRMFEERVLVALEVKLHKVREARRKALAESKMVPPLPLMVVIDSISAIRIHNEQKEVTLPTAPSSGFQEAVAPRAASAADLRQRLIHFVETCRKLGALVVLVSAERNEVSNPLDYLVDVVTTLRVENGDDHTSKPLRLFTLSKSRHQMARHGTHVFHLSGESGFRFAPQLPSQIDAQHALQHMLWDHDTSVEVLNIIRKTESNEYERREFLSLPIRSHILLHGRGSTGKAGLALKVALAPRFTKAHYNHELSCPRVLVVSFLYPESYYEELRRRILNRFSREREALEDFGFDEAAAAEHLTNTPKLGFVHFAPGFLSAEDLYSRLVRALEGARLEGRPYSVVIIDGLHNLALQFPGARDTDVLWPIVYGTLSRANVSTITTFTMLELMESRKSTETDSPEETLFRLRTHLPLLHALVQASDYVIGVSHADQGDYYETRVYSAINREPPRESLLWDRGSLEFVRPVDRGNTASAEYTASALPSRRIPGRKPAPTGRPSGRGSGGTARKNDK